MFNQPKNINYGKLELKTGVIVRSIEGEIKYEIPVKEVKVIGEYTNGQGPYLDDWFLVIITKNDWIEVPMYVLNIDEFLSELGNDLNCNLNYRLANSNNWKTRIIFPHKLKEKELYKIVKNIPKSIVDKVKKSIGLGESKRFYSMEVEELLKN